MNKEYFKTQTSEEEDGIGTKFPISNCSNISESFSSQASLEYDTLYLADSEAPSFNVFTATSLDSLCLRTSKESGNPSTSQR